MTRTALANGHAAVAVIHCGRWAILLTWASEIYESVRPIHVAHERTHGTTRRTTESVTVRGIRISGNRLIIPRFRITLRMSSEPLFQRLEQFRTSDGLANERAAQLGAHLQM